MRICTVQIAKYTFHCSPVFDFRISINLDTLPTANATSDRVAVKELPQPHKMMPLPLSGHHLARSIELISVEFVTALQLFMANRLRMSSTYCRWHIVTLPSLLSTSSMPKTYEHLPLSVLSKRFDKSDFVRIITFVALPVTSTSSTYTSSSTWWPSIIVM